jgi:hypothetical protein
MAPRQKTRSYSVRSNRVRQTWKTTNPTPLKKHILPYSENQHSQITPFNFATAIK